MCAESIGFRHQSTRYHRGDLIGNRFAVYRSLVGGMAEVYFCLDTTTDYPIVLKAPQERFKSDTQFRLKFNEEVRTWIALENHPNIVRCFTLEEFDHIPFASLEWIIGDGHNGVDLQDFILQGPLDLKSALQITIGICSGLSHAQSKVPGIVHRDLKPANILIAQGKLAKITDFGLARSFSAVAESLQGDGGHNGAARKSPTKGLIGTPNYMSPEQWCNGRLDCQTDIYAIGCILFEMLEGRPAFNGSSLAELANRHIKGPIPVLPQKALTPVNTLIQNCLAKNKGNRIRTITELFEKLTKLYAELFSESPVYYGLGAPFSAEDYYNRAVALSRLGLYEKALIDLNRAIDNGRTSPEVFSLRGDLYRELQCLDKALSDLNYAIQLDNKLWYAYHNRGLLFSTLKRFPDAISDYTRALDLHPDPSTYAMRGDIYTAMRRFELAEADIAKSLQLDRNESYAYRYRFHLRDIQGRYEEATADYEKAKALEPLKISAIDYHRGRSLIDAGQANMALAYLDRAVKGGYRERDVRLERSNALTLLGLHQDAIDECNEIIKENPTDLKAYNCRGASYMEIGKFEEAKADFEMVLGKDKNNGDAYSNRGSLIMESSGPLCDAIDDYKRAIQINPYQPHYHYNLGMALLQCCHTWSELNEIFQHLQAAKDFGMSHADAIIRNILEAMEQEKAGADDVSSLSGDSNSLVMAIRPSLNDLRKLVNFLDTLRERKGSFVVEGAEEQNLINLCEPAMKCDAFRYVIEEILKEARNFPQEDLILRSNLNVPIEPRSLQAIIVPRDQNRGVLFLPYLQYAVAKFFDQYFSEKVQEELKHLGYNPTTVDNAPFLMQISGARDNSGALGRERTISFSCKSNIATGSSQMNLVLGLPFLATRPEFEGLYQAVRVLFILGKDILAHENQGDFAIEWSDKSLAHEEANVSNYRQKVKAVIIPEKGLEFECLDLGKKDCVYKVDLPFNSVLSYIPIPFPVLKGLIDKLSHLANEELGSTDRDAIWRIDGLVTQKASSAEWDSPTIVGLNRAYEEPE